MPDLFLIRIQALVTLGILAVILLRRKRSPHAWTMAAWCCFSLVGLAARLWHAPMWHGNAVSQVGQCACYLWWYVNGGIESPPCATVA